MIQKITSTTNQIVKDVVKLQQKKYREDTNLFIAEGEKAISVMMSNGFKIEKLFVLGDDKILKTVHGETYIVNEAVMEKMSTTKSCGNYIAVMKQKNHSISDVMNKKRLVLLENIKDAGNLGTILRSCKAFDIDGVLLLGDAIDIYNPKVIRAAVGYLSIPVVSISYDDIGKFRSHNIYSTALYKDAKPLSQVEFKSPFIVAFGSEADGLSKEFLKNDTQNILIEMSKNVESLNLATSVSICLYEIFKKAI